MNPATMFPLPSSAGSSFGRMGAAWKREGPRRQFPRGPQSGSNQTALSLLFDAAIQVTRRRADDIAPILES
jgi:hypothetical protein